MKIWFLLISVLILSACHKQFDLQSSGTKQNLILEDSGVAIIGGQMAKTSDPVTWSTVALVADIKGVPTSVCTGVILAENLVVTAHHCVAAFDKSEYKIFRGEELPKKMRDKRLIAVEQVVANHTKFEPVFDEQGRFVTNLYDVALIKTKAPIYGGIPVEIVDSEEIKPGLPLIIAGYGAVDDEFFRASKELRWTDVQYVRTENESILVVDQQSGKGSCLGDSGGPAFVEIGPTLYLVGITRGPHQENGGDVTHCHGYGEFTKLSSHKAFILEAAERLGTSLPSFKALGADFKGF